jgi:uncharacterized protein (DUF433 family)
MIAVSIDHISLDEHCVAYITGTQMKVLQIVREMQSWGLTPEEIYADHPHLSLAQVYAALTYYYDHQEELDAQMTQSDAEHEDLRATVGESPFIARMRSEGKLPR